MLKHLRVSNLAIVSQLEVSFQDGLTVLTGETGAGKSILIDALGLALGERVDSGMLRSGCESAEVSAVFDVRNHTRLLRQLAEQSLEAPEGELLLRRVINRDGRARGYVNASATTARILRALGALLVDVCGQHGRQLLLKRDEQRALLDECGDYTELLQQVGQAFARWDNATRALQQLEAAGGGAADRTALLRYQLEELNTLAPEAEEPARLTEEHKRLAHADSLLETVADALQTLHESVQSARDHIDRVRQQLVALEQHDPHLTELTELLENATIQLDEAISGLRSYRDGLDPDPARLHEVERRLEALHDAARKHQVQPHELFTHTQALCAQLETAQDNEARIQTLTQEEAQARQDYDAAAAKLDKARRSCAETMSADVTNVLRTLGMAAAEFYVDVQTTPQSAPQRFGNNQIEFLVTVNPGQAMQPLRKVASGGELSRISLAIRVCATRKRPAATMIFDEVDAGIGGAVAEIVGQRLAELAQQQQTLCVTHLPQVACQGAHHLHALKTMTAATTETRILELDATARVTELARMLGGLTISEQTRAHARELLAQHQTNG